MEKEEEEELQSLMYAAQLVNSSVLPMVLHAVIQLEVFDIMAEAGPNAQLSASEIVSGMADVKNPNAAVMLDRMLCLLVGHSVLTCSVSVEAEKRYGLAPVGKYFVKNEGASLVDMMALLQDKVFIDSWFELKNAVLEGGVPFDRVHGINAFEYPAKDPRFNEVFNKAMISHTNIVMLQVLELYKGFENLNRLVDVGGGLGITLSIITSSYPTIKGINFDLPHVIKNAPAYPGVEHVGGDMFESVPQGDAIFMKWILHDWSDDHCVKLLKNCHNALPKNGKIIVVEAMLPAKPEPNAAFIITSQSDMVMMTQNPGGKERTEKEFRALATGAGFRGINIVVLLCNYVVMEFYK